MSTKPNPAECQIAAAEMRAFDREIGLARREERESVRACAVENMHNAEERQKLALACRKPPPPVALSAPSTAQLELADKGGNGARRLTPAEEDQMQAERTAERLSHFHGKQGKHGPLGRVRHAVMLRLPRETDLRLVGLASELETTETALLDLVAVLVSKVDPHEFYGALAELQKHCPK